MSSPLSLLKLLSDRNIYSGSWLGEQLGLSRAAVWKQIQQLQQEGLLIESVHAKGYRLQTHIELLETETILQRLPAAIQQRVQLQIFEELESTNKHLMQPEFEIQSHEIPVCLAEKQSAGRGRLGRSWQTGFASSLAMSLRWRFAGDASGLAGLSLAVGVAVANVVKTLGVRDVGIKWPNDLLCNHAKLAGILIEITGDAAGPCEVVIGIGLNVSNSTAKGGTGTPPFDQPWTDLLSNMPPKQNLSRNQIAAKLMIELVNTLDQFAEQGFAAFQQSYTENDALKNTEISVQTATRKLSGIACGVNDTGGLLLAVGEEIKTITSGDVRVRAAWPK